MTDQTQPVISDYFSDFQQALEEKDRRPRTIGGYLNDLAQFVAWWEQQRDGQPPALAAITPSAVRDYRRQLRAIDRLSPPTINRRLAALRVFLQWAADAGLLPANPAARVPGLKLAQPAAPRWLSPAEQTRLLAALDRAVLLAQSMADDPAAGMALQAIRDRALLILLLNTGLRVLEAASLSLADVGLNGRSGAVVVHEGRGGQPRTIPLNLQTRQALAEYLALRPDQPTDRLFVGQRGPIGPRQVLRLLKKYARQAGLEPAQVSVHTLRHTFGRNLVRAGAAIEEVAALMGHASLNTTRLYATPSRQDLQRAVERLEGKEE